MRALKLNEAPHLAWKLAHQFCKKKWVETVIHFSNGRANDILSLYTSFFFFFFTCNSAFVTIRRFFQQKLSHQSPYLSVETLNMMYTMVWVTGFTAYFSFSLAFLTIIFFSCILGSTSFTCRIQINALSFQGCIILWLPSLLHGRKSFSKVSSVHSTASWDNFGQVYTRPFMGL